MNITALKIECKYNQMYKNETRQSTEDAKRVVLSDMRK